MAEQSAAERKAIGKRVRFEVFKRDGFKCQYCGAQVPETVLEVDHINPVSKGGDNDIMNLVTACRACNAGKSNIPLSDDAAIRKQRAMLDELNERREQLEMMLAWREGLKKLDDDAVMKAVDVWQKMTPSYRLNDYGLKELNALLEKVPLLQVLDAMHPQPARAINGPASQTTAILSVVGIECGQFLIQFLRGVIHNGNPLGAEIVQKLRQRHPGQFGGARRCDLPVFEQRGGQCGVNASVKQGVGKRYADKQRHPAPCDQRQSPGLGFTAQFAGTFT